MKRERDLLRRAAAFTACILLSGCLLDEPDGTGAVPVIWGEPPTVAAIDTPYVFSPEAADEDGDLLTFSIVNQPAWADFDTATGRLDGVPAGGDVGEYRDIVISVADGRNVVSLPVFSITVQATLAADGDAGAGPEGGAPTIAGEPNRYAVAGTVYAFRPEASDPDGGSLSFSIENKPAWATFDPATGLLRGKPTGADVGETAPIAISVVSDDGIAALPPFTIAVEAIGTRTFPLAWEPPTANEDGSPLTDLAGYRIHYGMLPGDYTETVELPAPGLTEYVLANLAHGRYYVAMTAVNSLAMESRYSEEVEITPQP
jgi:hypothetical protein